MEAQTQIQTEAQPQVLLNNGENSRHESHHKRTAPDIPGFKRVWEEEFKGPKGSAPSEKNWERIESWPWRFPANDEFEGYMNSTEFTYLSGDGTLNIVPKRVTPVVKGGAEWASGRIHCKHSWKCEEGERMIFRAEIKLGDNPRQMGIWPAFWALGENFRTAPIRPWPSCGEWDILEVVNGRSINHATPHFTYNLTADRFDKDDAGNGFSRTTGFDRSKWHSFAFEVSREAKTWEQETMIWRMDGNEYTRLTGAQIGQKEAWDCLTKKPFFPILNVAVGGIFPDLTPGPAGGPNPGIGNTPTADTQDGIESGMRVRYVAVYKSRK